jgi:hypothetical protein
MVMMCHSSIVMYIQLGIDRLLTIWWQKRSNSVNKLSMKPERVRPSSSSIEGAIQFSSH